jgi:glycosyltransferase involved in cell wall biosynthesis
VIAYNEETTIKSILSDILAQDYDHSKIEVLLVDSASTDATKKMMREFATKNNSNSGVLHFRDIRVLDNPKKTLPCGWNVALHAYKGEAIVKVDAHASIPHDFLSKNIATLESGEDICGGQRPNIIESPTPWKETLLLAETSMFGSSIAPYRNNPGKTYVKSMFHAAYKRKVFDKIGNFNENLTRTEDNEIHYRMREAGFQLCFDPEIISYQHTRSTLKTMLKQKFANGYWIGLTTGVCPKCLSLYHFVPFAFVGSLGSGYDIYLIFRLSKSLIRFLTGLMWVLYWILALLMTVVSVVQAGKKRNITCVLLPILFFILHISYGTGTLIGMIKMPAWVKGIENGRDEER